jgi:hypothetical protein
MIDLPHFGVVVILIPPQREKELALRRSTD